MSEFKKLETEMTALATFFTSVEVASSTSVEDAEDLQQRVQAAAHILAKIIARRNSDPTRYGTSMLTRISAVESTYEWVKASAEALVATARSREAAAARTQQFIEEAVTTMQAFTAAARAAQEREAAEIAAREAAEQEAERIIVANEQARRRATLLQQKEARLARMAEVQKVLQIPVRVHILKEDGAPLVSVDLCRGSCVEEALPKTFCSNIFVFVDQKNARIDDGTRIGSLLDLESSSSSSSLSSSSASLSLAAAAADSVGEITLRLAKRVKEGRVYVAEVNRRLNKETCRQLLVEGFACSMLCMNQNGCAHTWGTFKDSITKIVDIPREKDDVVIEDSYRWGSTIYLDWTLMIVFIKPIWTPKPFRFESRMELGEAVSALKEFIEAKTGLPKSDQRLVFNGTPLEDDDAAIASCGILEEGTLNLALRPGSKMDLEIAELRSAAKTRGGGGGGGGGGDRPGRSPLLSSRSSP